MENKLLQKINPYMKKLECWLNIPRILEFTDHIVTVIGNSEYKGENPALRAIYAPMRISMVIMVILFFVLFVLGGLVPIESAAIARGTIVVLTNKKTVQHLEGGIIRSILVKEGDIVKEGQPLMELNDIAQKASKAIVQTELYINRVTEARLIALKDGRDEFEIPNAIQNVAQKDSDLLQAISTQQDLFTTQRDTIKGKLDTLKQRVKEYNEEITGLEAQVQSVNGQLALIKQEEKPMAELVRKGYAAKPQLIAIQRQQEELKGNHGQYTASIAKARQSIIETDLQLVNATNEFNTINTTELREVQSKIADLEEKLRASTDIVSRSVITSPTEGRVTALKFHTIGGVISPSAPIMDIVPQNEKLVVEAQVNPADIDVIVPDMPTKILFSAYKSRSTPRLGGKIVNVSADVLTQQQGMQALTYYLARVEVDAEELSHVGQSIKLYPGMQVEVFIQTGSRSFLAYLFAPITSSLERAFRED